MHKGVEKWVNNLLRVTENAGGSEFFSGSQSEMYEFATTVNSSVHNFFNLAKTSADYRITVKDGLKKTPVSPLVFASNLLLQVSKLAQQAEDWDQTGIAAYSFIANNTMHEMVGFLSYLKVSHGLDEARHISGINEHFNNPDMSLNVIYTLNQTQNHFTIREGFHHDRADVLDAYSRGEFLKVNVPNQFNLAGVNADLLHLLLADSLIDYPSFFMNIDSFDKNEPYAYRLSALDFRGAAFLVSEKIKTIPDLEAAGHYCSKYSRTVLEMLVNEKLFSDLNIASTKTIVSTDNLSSFSPSRFAYSAQLVPTQKSYQLEAVEGIYSSVARGISPISGFASDDPLLLQLASQPDLYFLITTCVSDAAIFAGKSTFSGEEMLAAQRELEQMVQRRRF